MQIVILAGGLGTRLSEETDLIPKPMVRIGDIPILHHIMNYYSKFGHTNFIIALGYKGEVIQKYFDRKVHNKIPPHWKISLIDTGLNTSTGGRIKLLENYLDNEFMLTYGDGLSNVDLNKLAYHHDQSKKIATVTAVRPPARFGSIEIAESNLVSKFSEKDPQSSGWINGGFFCFNKKICSLLLDLHTSLESGPLNNLVEIQELTAYKHYGWWQPMDTLREKRILEEIWNTGDAPWLVD